MNKDIMLAMGFHEEVAAVESGHCPFCKQKIREEDFNDELSRREFGISGLCQQCQDDTF